MNTMGGSIAERMGGSYNPVTGEFDITYPDGPERPQAAVGTLSVSAGSAAASTVTVVASTAAAASAADPHLNETLQKMWNAIDAVEKESVTAGDNITVEGGKVSVVKNPEFESVKVAGVNIGEEGINMGGGVVTGLANGGVYQGSSDVVTGDQLWNAYRRIDTIDERVQVVGAHAAALSAMYPVAYNPYEPTTISAGVGWYRNEQSLAVGVFHYVKENVLVNAGVAFNSDGDTMGRAGISFALGKSGRKQPSMIKDVSEMQRQMAAMQQMLTQLKDENEKNKDIIKELKEVLEKKK